MRSIRSSVPRPWKRSRRPPQHRRCAGDSFRSGKNLPPAVPHRLQTGSRHIGNVRSSLVARSCSASLPLVDSDRRPSTRTNMRPQSPAEVAKPIQGGPSLEQTSSHALEKLVVDAAAVALIKAGLARGCPRFSGRRYVSLEQPAAETMPFPIDCHPRCAGPSGKSGLDAAPEDDAHHQRAPAVSRRHGAHVGATVGRRDTEDLVPGDPATDVEHHDALTTVAKAAHRGRPAVLPVAAGHAVFVLEARVPVVSLGPGRGEARERGDDASAEFTAHDASVASGRVEPIPCEPGCAGRTGSGESAGWCLSERPGSLGDTLPHRLGYGDQFVRHRRAGSPEVRCAFSRARFSSKFRERRRRARTEVGLKSAACSRPACSALARSLGADDHGVERRGYSGTRTFLQAIIMLLVLK